jgi:hypothetical protein
MAIRAPEKLGTRGLFQHLFDDTFLSVTGEHGEYFAEIKVRILIDSS